MQTLLQTVVYDSVYAGVDLGRVSIQRIARNVRIASSSQQEPS